MSANDNQMSDKDFKEIKEKESDELVLNCRKPEGELGEKMIQRMNKSHENLAQWGVSHLNVCEDDDILDIGCGGGVNVKRFAGMTNGKVYGIDYSETSVKESEKYNKEEIDYWYIHDEIELVDSFCRCLLSGEKSIEYEKEDVLDKYFNNFIESLNIKELNKIYEESKEIKKIIYKYYDTKGNWKIKK